MTTDGQGDKAAIREAKAPAGPPPQAGVKPAAPPPAPAGESVEQAGYGRLQDRRMVAELGGLAECLVDHRVSAMTGTQLVP